MGFFFFFFFSLPFISGSNQAGVGWGGFLFEKAKKNIEKKNEEKSKERKDRHTAFLST